MDVESKATIELAISSGKAAANELVDHVALRFEAGSVDLLARAEATAEKLIDHAFAKLQSLVSSLDGWALQLSKPDK